MQTTDLNMSCRLLVFALLFATACSQRSPWVVVSPVPAPQAVASAPGAAVSAPAPAPADATAVAHLGALTFPVSGIDSTRLDDSFDEPRDGGARTHRAIDILAPKGSAVLSVQDGRILRLSKSEKGGITVYATDLEEQFVYYYAHLDRYHAKVYAGKPLMRGDTLGYVGTTGNAPKNLPHLHFQVMRMPADRKFWAGDPVNPYPLLRATVSTVGQ
jgi:murein DD-endopeptidase MepM/ murein hydrolase activator NlpD